MSQKDLFEAVEVVLVGKRKERPCSQPRRSAALFPYHEVGHALVSALQKDARESAERSPLYRGQMGALGYVLNDAGGGEMLKQQKRSWKPGSLYFWPGQAAEALCSIP